MQKSKEDLEVMADLLKDTVGYQLVKNLQIRNVIRLKIDQLDLGM